MLLEQFDSEKNAVINPGLSYASEEPFPETVISIFSHQLFGQVLEKLGGKIVAYSPDVDGDWPVYEVVYKGKRMAYAKARLGAPACVGVMEEVMSMGAKRLLMMGNCGVIAGNIEDCGIIIPDRAIRDEGTSYHYAPASDYIDVNRYYKEEFQEICRERGFSYVVGTTWTTDGFFRETRKKIDDRIKMGAITVEMECSALQAMCDFRGYEFFQFLYAGDSLEEQEWDPRSLSGEVKLDYKEELAFLLFELAAKL